jgi:hypothetical protein
MFFLFFSTYYMHVDHYSSEHVNYRTSKKDLINQGDTIP